MNYPNLLCAAAAVAALGAGGVLAQTTPPTPQAGPSPVVTDVGPAPAEDRSSAGAVVLENSLVRAQRQNAFERSASRTGVASVGSGVMRATMRAATQSELAEARLSEALELRTQGASSLDQK
jgi:hypothetical protein